MLRKNNRTYNKNKDKIKKKMTKHFNKFVSYQAKKLSQKEEKIKRTILISMTLMNNVKIRSKEE